VAVFSLFWSEISLQERTSKITRTKNIRKKALIKSIEISLEMMI